MFLILKLCHVGRALSEGNLINDVVVLRWVLGCLYMLLGIYGKLVSQPLGI